MKPLFLVTFFIISSRVSALFPIICTQNNTLANSSIPLPTPIPKPICTRLIGDEPADVCIDLKSNHYRVQFRDCLWLRFNVEEARSLLRGKHLLLIGDSRVRYQYLSLVYWLLTGQIEANSTSRCIANEKEFRSWIEFYRETNAALSQFGAKELCDCYRNPTTIETIENRHWVWNGMKVTYFELFVEVIRGHTYFVSSELGCTPGNCSAPPLWTSGVNEAIERIVSVMNVTHMVVTNGWNPTSTLVASPTWNKTASTLESRGIRVFVMERSAVGQGIERRSYPIFNNGEILIALDIFSSHYYSLPESRWDKLHYHPWVYSDFNQLLLHAIAQP